jgi:hypothetical protein
MNRTHTLQTTTWAAMNRSQPLKSITWATLRRGILLPGTLFAVAALNACGGGSSMSTMPSGSNPPPTVQACSAATCGSAVATLTDAAGDFLTYQVGLVSLQLKKSDGTLVETLPAGTTVDLVQLVNLSEIITAGQIPNGEYVAALVTVDYTAASIMVDDGTGAGVAVSPVDSTGAPLAQVRLTVQLDPAHDLHINAGKLSRIAFDFNLLASNTVDLTAKTVTVNPVLVASIAAADNKQIRVRGSLAGVDTAGSDYTVNVKPFHDEGEDHPQSTFVVHTNDATSFEIDGTPFSGAAGLAQLATLPSNAMVVAFGALQTADQSFLAARVLAGTSVEGPNLDHLSGSVIARSGNTLTIHGAEFDGHDGHDGYESHNASISIADATAVTVEGQMAAAPAHTMAEISVGSHIDAFGVATRDNTGKVVLDSTSGRVRLDFTRLQGSVSAASQGNITLNLTDIDHQSVSLFSFAGTGTAAAQDSNPSSYLLNTGNLDLTAFLVGKPLLAIGFVAPFGAAPPDFNVVTLANGDADVGDVNNDHNGMDVEDDAQLEMEWGNAGTTAPFKAVDATHLDLDIANPQISDKHFIESGPQVIDLKTLGSDPSIVTDTAAMTLFSIAHEHGGMTESFNGFADFAAALAAELNGSELIFRLNADGHYDSAANTFTARRITVRLGN